MDLLSQHLSRSQYKPLRDNLEKMTDQKKEPLMFEEFDAKKVGQTMDDQRAIVESAGSEAQNHPKSASYSMTSETTVIF